MKASDLVARFGGHPVGKLGIDLETSDGPGRWLVAACLYGGRIDSEIALAAARALTAADLAEPKSVAAARPEALEALLIGVGYPAPDVTAYKLWRACDSLATHYGGSLDSLAAQSEQLEDLAGRLARLAPGFGTASVARFLRPLRDRWVQAREIPLHPAARAAAIHLGLLAEGEDEEGEPGALRAALREDPAQPSLADVEFALTQLGTIACSKNRTARCPLGDACPRRADETQTLD
ncbi:MAG: hypothetical protein JRE38_01430 [Deltaproteobacteria bacterium]|nr:hypothetical protein [Deltaproteobacteria bacterium]